MGLDCLFTVTDQPDSSLARGMIDKTFLEEHIDDFKQPFYVCGPPKMVEEISEQLESLGADSNSITFED